MTGTPNPPGTSSAAASGQGAQAPELVAVRDLFVSCSFPMRPDAIAMSDCCRRLAVAAVVDTAGNRLWRCREHDGQVRRGQSGESVDRVRRPA